jgi:hypothetical protein
VICTLFFVCDLRLISNAILSRRPARVDRVTDTSSLRTRYCNNQYRYIPGGRARQMRGSMCACKIRKSARKRRPTLYYTVLEPFGFRRYLVHVYFSTFPRLPSSTHCKQSARTKDYNFITLMVLSFSISALVYYKSLCTLKRTRIVRDPKWQPP